MAKSFNDINEKLALFYVESLLNCQSKSIKYYFSYIEPILKCESKSIKHDLIKLFFSEYFEENFHFKFSQKQTETKDSVEITKSVGTIAGRTAGRTKDEREHTELAERHPFRAKAQSFYGKVYSKALLKNSRKRYHKHYSKKSSIADDLSMSVDEIRSLVSSKKPYDFLMDDMNDGAVTFPGDSYNLLAQKEDLTKSYLSKLAEFYLETLAQKENITITKNYNYLFKSAKFWDTPKWDTFKIDLSKIDRFISNMLLELFNKNEQKEALIQDILDYIEDQWDKIRQPYKLYDTFSKSVDYDFNFSDENEVVFLPEPGRKTKFEKEVKDICDFKNAVFIRNEGSRLLMKTGLKDNEVYDRLFVEQSYSYEDLETFRVMVSLWLGDFLSYYPVPTNRSNQRMHSYNSWDDVIQYGNYDDVKILAAADANRDYFRVRTIGPFSHSRLISKAYAIALVRVLKKPSLDSNHIYEFVLNKVLEKNSRELIFQTDEEIAGQYIRWRRAGGKNKVRISDSHQHLEPYHYDNYSDADYEDPSEFNLFSEAPLSLNITPTAVYHGAEPLQNEVVVEQKLQTEAKEITEISEYVPSKMQKLYDHIEAKKIKEECDEETAKHYYMNLFREAIRKHDMEKIREHMTQALKHDLDLNALSDEAIQYGNLEMVKFWVDPAQVIMNKTLGPTAHSRFVNKSYALAYVRSLKKPSSDATEILNYMREFIRELQSEAFIVQTEEELGGQFIRWRYAAEDVSIRPTRGSRPVGKIKQRILSEKFECDEYAVFVDENAGWQNPADFNRLRSPQA